MSESPIAQRDVGAIATVLAFGSVLLATVLSPAFAWQRHALSNLGVTTTAPGTGLTVLLFNGGLVVGGLLGLVYARYRYVTGADTLGRLVGVSVGLTMLSMSGVGVFPQGQAMHFPVAAGFYGLISATTALDGIRHYRNSRTRWAAASLLLAGANLAAWGLWAATGPFTRPGLAMPEFVGAAALSAWVFASTIRHRRAELSGE